MIERTIVLQITVHIFVKANLVGNIFLCLRCGSILFLLLFGQLHTLHVRFSDFVDTGFCNKIRIQSLRGFHKGQ